MTHFIINTQTNEIYYEGISLEDCEYNMPHRSKTTCHTCHNKDSKYIIQSEDAYDLMQDKDRKFIKQTPVNPDTLQYHVTWQLSDGRQITVPMKLG